MRGSIQKAGASLASPPAPSSHAAIHEAISLRVSVITFIRLPHALHYHVPQEHAAHASSKLVALATCHRLRLERFCGLLSSLLYFSSNLAANASSPLPCTMRMLVGTTHPCCAFTMLSDRHCSEAQRMQ